MKNAIRITRDVGFLVGRYERGEITAESLVAEVYELTRKSCGHCIFSWSGKCKTDDTATCDEGYAAWLNEEVDT